MIPKQTYALFPPLIIQMIDLTIESPFFFLILDG